jgi:hypothetical protein
LLSDSCVSGPLSAGVRTRAAGLRQFFLSLSSLSTKHPVASQTLRIAWLVDRLTNRSSESSGMGCSIEQRLRAVPEAEPLSSQLGARLL